MKRINKYLYLFVVQGAYGYGWEDLTASESYKAAIADLRDYRKNDSYAIGLRIIKRRELNPKRICPDCGSDNTIVVTEYYDYAAGELMYGMHCKDCDKWHDVKAGKGDN